MATNLLACRLASYAQYTQHAWEHLPQLGIRCIEAPIPESPEQAADLSKYVQAGALHVSSFQGKLDIQQEDVAGQLREQLAFCKQFDTDRLFLSVRREELREEDAYARLRQAGDLAHDSGIILMLETHPDLVTNGDVGVRTMRGVDHPNVRINFDTANIYFYNDDADSVTELRKVLDWVEGVHLKDSKGVKGKFDFPALGRGIVDFAAIVRALNERGFRGPFTMELEGTHGVTPTLEEILDHVAESAQYLRSTGLF